MFEFLETAHTQATLYWTREEREREGERGRERERGGRERERGRERGEKERERMILILGEQITNIERSDRASDPMRKHNGRRKEEGGRKEPNNAAAEANFPPCLLPGPLSPPSVTHSLSLSNIHGIPP